MSIVSQSAASVDSLFPLLSFQMFHLMSTLRYALTETEDDIDHEAEAGYDDGYQHDHADEDDGQAHSLHQQTPDDVDQSTTSEGVGHVPEDAPSASATSSASSSLASSLAAASSSSSSPSSSTSSSTLAGTLPSSIPAASSSLPTYNAPKDVTFSDGDFDYGDGDFLPSNEADADADAHAEGDKAAPTASAASRSSSYAMQDASQPEAPTKSTGAAIRQDNVVDESIEFEMDEELPLPSDEPEDSCANEFKATAVPVKAQHSLPPTSSTSSAPSASSSSNGTVAHEDLNKVSAERLAAVKAEMELEFEKNRVKPGTEGYKYDVRKEFEVDPDATNDWDME